MANSPVVGAAVLTDIEGTTTDIAFVHKMLFPYSRERIGAFLSGNAADPEVRAALAEIRGIENRGDLSEAEIVATLTRWIDEDRKFKPLKTLQGLIWRKGYEGGVLESHLYADVGPALRRWHDAGIALYVYSSGSVAAQKLLFAHTLAGDLTPLFSGYFDTSIGAKIEAASYRTIAQAVGRDARSILFLSDHDGELAAAKSAGLRVVKLDRARPPDRPPATESGVPVASSFDWIDPAAETGVGAYEPLRSLPTMSLR